MYEISNSISNWIALGKEIPFFVRMKKKALNFNDRESF